MAAVSGDGVLAAGVALTIVAGYALALWWLLRRERPSTIRLLLILCGLSLALRLVYTTEYPFGLFEDEPKMLGCSVEAVQLGTFFGESCIHVPYLFMAVFGATLVPIIGASRWAMRGYPIVTSVLATLAVFAAARSLRLRVAPSLAAAAFVAVLPWSIFYGRIALGGELILHQALLLAGLAALVMDEDSGVAAALIAGFGLCLLLWDYWAGRAMIAMPLVATVLARGRRRLWCLAVIPIALVGWIPHLATGPLDAFVGMSLATSRGAPMAGSFHAGFREAPLQTLLARGAIALRAFVWPVAQDSIFTMRSVARHPPVLLAIAALGVLTGVRRGLFLLGGFAIGLVPGVVSGSEGVSAHRIMMSYVFVSLAAAAALNIRWRWPRRAVVLAAVVFAAMWSVPLYFSSRFWPPEWQWNVDTDNTALREALLQHLPQRLVIMRQIGYFGYLAPTPQSAELLTVDNWLPASNQPTTYLFTWQAEPLRAQYEHVLPANVRPIGRKSFLVDMDSRDWGWLRQYGWAYEVRCGDDVHTAQVPFLYSLNLSVWGFNCQTPMVHTWRARWHGGDSEMVLQFSGHVTIAGRDLSVDESGYERRLPFRMPADSDVTVTMETPPGQWPLALLLERSAAGERAPAWDAFTPVWKVETAAPPSP